MTSRDTQPPVLLPILSRGKHRNPRKGACFMELASYLAGERWSDHPACTHPLLAAVARYVNDFTTDAGRPKLAPLIPSVIGLTSDDPRLSARIALLCARTALPVVAAERQRVMAVAILACEEALAELEGRPPGLLEERSEQVLAQVPHATQWARRFTGDRGISPYAVHRHGGSRTAGYAVAGIAHACVKDPDGMLRDLLVAAIEETADFIREERRAMPRTGFDPDSWTAACRLTGVVTPVR